MAEQKATDMRLDDTTSRSDIGSPGTDAAGARANALWGGRRTLTLLLVFTVTALAALAGRTETAEAAKYTALVPPALLEAAEQNPDAVFDVIVQGAESSRSHDVSELVTEARGEAPSTRARGLKRVFASISGTSAQLTGKQIVRLAKKRYVFAITPDSKVGATYSNSQLWVPATDTESWSAPSTYQFPTIAIVDSGVQPRADFGSRLRTQVNFVSSGPNAPGDGYGHGTMVAGIAAGSAEGYTGMAPQSDIVSLDVLDDNGAGVVSDLIAACDWIIANKAQYNIRVANFSLNAGSGASILYDPLDRAVEKLWLNGVVVVAAAGNYGVSPNTPSGVRFAPANDPFVITVGAADVNGTASNSNDFAAPWSAWGYTYDGFFKPDLAAPGRHIVSPVPAGATLAAAFSHRKVGSDYMWMSGTSFAAPVVSGAAAYLLARYPNWTPDQVKGGLLLDVDQPYGYGGGSGSLGLGMVDADGWVGTSSPPNPNAALTPFVTTSWWTGLKSFDASAWSNAAAANASWASASWASASWSSASWSSASWASASWSSASWSSASWASASWASASWSSASWASSIGVE